MIASKELPHSADPYARQLKVIPRLAPEMMTRVITVAIAILLGAGRVLAQTPDPQPPGYVGDPARPPLNPFPAEQDWSFLSRPALHPDFFDPAKYIRLGDDPQKYLSLGLEYRTEYEYYDNWMFGAGPQDHNGYVLSRVMPHFDFHGGRDLRLFSEFKFDYVAGRVGGPRPGVDQAPGDVHQAFLEWAHTSVANMAVVCGWAARKSYWDRDASLTTTKARM